MKLTDEQYNRITRYADDEMSENEKIFFEALLNRDENLLAEVQLYKEIRGFCESADQKIKDHLLLYDEEKKIGEEQIRGMIMQARKEWEEEHEEAMKPAIQQKVVARKELPIKKNIFIQRWNLLAAAVIIGIICFGVIWFIQNNSPASNTTASKPQEQNTVTKTDTIKTQPVIVANDTSQKKQSPSVVDNTKQDLKKLFAVTFKPDVAPKSNEALLDESFNSYTAKNFDDAIETFEMAKATLHTRSEKTREANTAFYIHYYLALSYMAAGNRNGKAIAELKEALKQSNNEFLKAKAQWYLALAYLKKGNTAEAKKYSSQLTITDNEYQQPALKLLHQLKGN